MEGLACGVGGGGGGPQLKAENDGSVVREGLEEGPGVEAGTGKMTLTRLGEEDVIDETFLRPPHVV